jgi:23S rRNA (uridine2479-2'-O)-methyltransferase
MKPVILRIRTENSDFQYIETLSRNRTKRHRAGEFFVEGVRAVTQAVEKGWEIRALVFSREKRLSDWAEGIITKAKVQKHYELSLPLMEKLSQKDDGSELIALVAIPPDDLARIPVHDHLLVVLLDRPTSPGNLGTILRSCDALGVDGVIVSGHAADLYDPETIRGTTGSFFHVPSVCVSSHQNLLPWLASLKRRFSGLQVVGSSAHAALSIRSFDFTQPTILLVGNETNGLSDAYQSLADAMVTIPMHGYASSLNIASATSILLYEVARQRGN